ncbi:ribonuclease III family protein [Actinidia rufa]|uniref:Ribonuclease III family protein n=1 Tax=Actinidia rufa TaxID=165716 RepID=A0A7J0G002_9ERIC|nr:ribonuclease III family protein [Actinidia rufa]
MVAASLSSLFSVKAASWDTQQRLPYNRQRTKPKKMQNPNTASSTTTTTTPQSLSLTTSISALLSRNIQSPSQGKFEETYLGYEAWLPTPPKVEKPRSIYNAASLAYIGDSIYEVAYWGEPSKPPTDPVHRWNFNGMLYARRHFLFPPLNIEEYNDRVMAVVRCEAQDAMLQKLLNEKCLSEEERLTEMDDTQGNGSGDCSTTTVAAAFSAATATGDQGVQLQVGWNPVKANDWILAMEKNFRLLRCGEQQKVEIGSYLLAGSLSPREQDRIEVRNEIRCFHCNEVGHIKRNCPRVRTEVVAPMGGLVGGNARPAERMQGQTGQ